MEIYRKYFENILSKTWLGEKKNVIDNKIEQSEIKSIFYEDIFKDKIILIGKTEKYNFILECFNSDNFYYANALLNTDMIYLLEGYKEKEIILKGVTPQQFVNNVMMKIKLEKELEQKNEPAIKKFKL